MKRKTFAIICIFIIISLLSSCALFNIGTGGSSSGKTGTVNDSQDENGDDFDDPAYLNEQDGAELVNIAHPESDFVGKWAAGSDYSEYLYGEVILTIKKDHTWSGSITDEEFSGVWAPAGDKITIEDSEGVIVWDLSFVKDGNLIFKNTRNPDVAIVLKPAD